MIKEKLRTARKAARKFNARPPTWAYWVGGVIVILMVQIVRVL